MNDLNKAIELYSLMAKRLENSNFTKNQAKTYREMVKLLQESNSMEDAEYKIKNSKYYLAPSVSKTIDTILIYKKIAIENDLNILIELCDKEMEKINSDQNSIYNSSFFKEAENILARYSQTIEGFISIFENYMNINFTNKEEENEVSKIIDNINNSFNMLILPSNDINELSSISLFRNLIPLNDDNYNKFINQVNEYKKGNYKNSNKTFLEYDINNEWKEINSIKNLIINNKEEKSKNTSIKLSTAISPHDDKGVYIFKNEEVIYE